MKFFVYRQLTLLCRWVAEVATQGEYRFNVCEDCGESKYYGQPCVGRILTYKAVN